MAYGRAGEPPPGGYRPLQRIRAPSVDKLDLEILRPAGDTCYPLTLCNGDEPPAILTFAGPDITWRVYAANPGLAVEEPRGYLLGTSEDFSDPDSKPSDPRMGTGGRIFLAL